MADMKTLHVYIESKGESWRHVRVRELSGREAISELFRFDVDVVCEPQHDLPEDALLGAEVSLVIEIDGDEVRRVHGILGLIQNQLDTPGDAPAYRLRIVPRASRLTLVETHEVYLDRSVPDILESKVKRYVFGSGELDLRLIEAYSPREFVVQVGESDLAFLCRLAEHVGISFYFEHEDGHDRLVFTDNPSGFLPLPGAAEVPFQRGGETTGVFALRLTTELTPTSYMVHDYNYRRPELDLAACYDIESGNGGGVVDYGAHVKTAEEAEHIARVRGEERLSRQRVYEGRSGCPALSAGRKASLVDHPRLPGPEPLLFVEVEHAATLPVFSEAEGPRKASYANTFRAIPAGVPYRPPRRTPKPRIHGVVTGIIQPGPGGETGGVARLDAEGRYTVQIHFDTAPPGEQKASHRMRMAQPFAGASYGMHFPLRPGTEVALAFANGDPDRPMIVGALFNAASPSPVVAGNATRHQIKSPTGAIFELVSKS